MGGGLKNSRVAKAETRENRGERMKDDKRGGGARKSSEQRLKTDRQLVRAKELWPPPVNKFKELPSLKGKGLK